MTTNTVEMSGQPQADGRQCWRAVGERSRRTDVWCSRRSSEGRGTIAPMPPTPQEPDEVRRNDDDQRAETRLYHGDETRCTSTGNTNGAASAAAARGKWTAPIPPTPGRTRRGRHHCQSADDLAPTAGSDWRRSAQPSDEVALRQLRAPRAGVNVPNRGRSTTPDCARTQPRRFPAGLRSPVTGDSVTSEVSLRPERR
jgi:hypothetical protein